jgi:hypothetical protein
MNTYKFRWQETSFHYYKEETSLIFGYFRKKIAVVCTKGRSMNNIVTCQPFVG